MQQYHFGRLALCLNRPADVITSPTTAFDRLQGYREVTKEVDYRCKEIVGIAAARPQSCARIYMPALLFAAGQCLEKQPERQVVEELLCGIGADLGWETDSEIQRLKDLWEER
ncbi:Carboxylesterase family protein [Aspergillus niger]|nr:Carboxylesterase family protein [Aspergillus niger]